MNKLFLIYLIPLFILCQEKIKFVSANPFSFKDIITNLKNQEKQEVYGILTFPENDSINNQYPLIIAVAGSEGWAEHHYEYLKMYRKSGIATFELCSFKSRNIISTVGTQTTVTIAMMILDSYRAFEKLENHPKINGKIAITGWSLGGGVTLFSAWENLKNAINPKVNFAAHLAFYPPCIVTPINLNFSKTPIHILIGELDNWTPPDACEELVKKINASGNNIGISIYKNSHHSFDRNSLPIIKKNGYILKDCRFTMREDGAVLMNFFNIPMTTPFLQKIGLSVCAKRGPTYGGNVTAKEKSFSFSQKFMEDNLLK